MKIQALFIALILTLWTSIASAGTLTVRDSQSLFSQADVTALNAEAKDWPYDVHLLVENASSMRQLEDDAHAWVDGPNAMVVAIDPTHHKTVTRFGTGTGVKTGDFDSITKAGNAHFRAHEFKQGVDAIVLRAKASTEAKQAISASTDPVVVQKGLSTGTWICIFLLAGTGIGLAVWMWRRAKREREQYERALDDNRLETSELRSRNIRDAAWEDRVTATTRSSGGSTVVVNNGSSGVGDFATGYALGSLSSDHYHEREVIHEREVVRETPSYSSSSSYGSSSSDDSGGSSSSWSSGSSSSYDSGSSSSYDSGGSSSSFDSGSSSSFDSGGSFGGGGDW